MGNIDNDPPKHLSASQMQDEKNWNVYKQGKLNLGGSGFMDWLLGKHRKVFFNMDEIRVLTIHGESPVMCHGNKMSRSAYKKALEQKEQAHVWLEEEKQSKAQQSNEDVME